MIRRLLFLFALICMISSVYSVTTISSLPYIISTPGEYNISGNLSSTGNGITFTTSNANLNCEGYTMTGDAGSWDYGIVISSSSYNYNNITNCNIYNFGTGISLYDGDYNNFSNLNINTTFSSFYLHYGTIDYNYFTNITFNKGFNLYTSTTNDVRGKIYFNNVSDGNGKYIISSIDVPLIIDGWTNISAIYLSNADNSVITNLNIEGDGNYSNSVFLLITDGTTSINISNVNLSNYNLGYYIGAYSTVNLENLTLKNGYYGIYDLDSTTYANNLNLNNYTVCTYKSGILFSINNSYFYNCSSVVNIVQSTQYNLYNSIYNNSNMISVDIYNNQNHCNHIFQNVTDENGKFFIYSYQKINIDNWNNISSIHLCNADNSTIQNLNYNGLNKNVDFIYARYLDYSNFTNLTIFNYSNGIYFVKNNYYNNLNNITSYKNTQNGIYLATSNYNNLNNFTSYKNSNSGIYVTQSAGYNNFTNFSVYNNTQHGIIANSGTNSYNRYINFITYNHLSGKGIYLDEGIGNIVENFTSYNNQVGLYLYQNSNHQSFNNFTIYNNTYGIEFLFGITNNTFSNGYCENNSNYNLYFGGFATTINNTFYNNYLGNKSKIYISNPLVNTIRFNSSLSGYNIGNYWNDFPACSSTETRGIYKVCLNPANYTINSTNNIYDFAPLIIAPEYIAPTPANNSNLGGSSFTITVEDTQGVSTWFNATINDVSYSMINTSSTTWEYTLTNGFTTITNVTFNVSYEGNGIMETRTFTYYPNHASEAFPVHTLLSGLITIMLILIVGFYLNKK